MDNASCASDAVNVNNTNFTEMEVFLFGLKNNVELWCEIKKSNLSIWLPWWHTYKSSGF